MDARHILLRSIDTLEKRMHLQRKRMAELRSINCDHTHASAILDEMTTGFVRLVERLERSFPEESTRYLQVKETRKVPPRSK